MVFHMHENLSERVKIRPVCPDHLLNNFFIGHIGCEAYRSALCLIDGGAVPVVCILFYNRRHGDSPMPTSKTLSKPAQAGMVVRGLNTSTRGHSPHAKPACADPGAAHCI